MELITVARTSEMPEYTDYWIWLAFVIGNFVTFIPTFRWPEVPRETGEEWYARMCKQRDEQKWWSWS